MVLIFVRSDGAVKCHDLKVGKVYDGQELLTLQGIKPDKEQLMALTKPQLKELISGVNLRITNFEKANKDRITQLILDEWDKIASRSTSVAVANMTPVEPSEPASSSGYVGAVVVNSSDIVENVDGGDFTVSDSDEDWTEKDEKALAFLRHLNTSSPFNINSDQLEQLEKKKRDFEEKAQSKGSDEVEEGKEHILSVTDFLDFLEIRSSDDVIDLDEGYLRDPSEYEFGNTIQVTIKEPVGGRNLFTFSVAGGCSIRFVKSRFAHQVSTLSKEQNRITEECFNLCLNEGGQVMSKCELDDEIQTLRW